MTMFVLGTVIITFIALALIIFTSKPPENFWGGYLPAPYLGQYVPKYGRCASVGNMVLVDPNARCINPNCMCVGCKGCNCRGCNCAGNCMCGH